MNSLLDKIKESEIVNTLGKDFSRRFVVQDNLSISLIVSSYFNSNKDKILVLCPNVYTAQDVYEKLVTFLGDDKVLFFPTDEILRIDINTYSKEMLSQRLSVLSECFDNKKRILVCHSASFTRYLPDVKEFEKKRIKYKVGDKIDLIDLEKKLISLGFSRVNRIDGPLEYSKRGDILDIFPINYDNPIRIEHFDDEIESIRYFEIIDQRSTKDVDELIIEPANDIILSDEQFSHIKETLYKKLELEKNRLTTSNYSKVKDRIDSLVDNIKDNGLDEGFYRLYPYFFDKPYTISDYFKEDITIIYDTNRVYKSLDFLNEQNFSYISELYKNGYCLPTYNVYADLYETLFKSKKIVNTYTEYELTTDLDLKVRAISKAAPNVYKAIDVIKEYIEEGNKVIVCLEDSLYETFKAHLEEFEMEYEETSFGQIPHNSLALSKEKLLEGFEFYEEKLIILTAREVFSYKPKTNRFIERYKKAKILKSYEELEPGDYVVHEERGIGQFESIDTLTVNNITKDYLNIRYLNDDHLFIPLDQFKVIRKYVSREGVVPKLSRIDGSDWKRTKNRIKDRVNLLADRLIALYAERNAKPGFACQKDDEFQLAFERAFPYSLTEDQRSALEDIKKDMESSRPMDRLLCGDVGFGKTEVAFRAAFKAMLSGGQVALLCPTTLLARQHYEVAKDRFALFGVNIALFSRFVPLKKQEQQIKEIKEGKIHFIIGTHRLLSKEIEIPNLRFLIIDEEQRFGVEHKERIKEVSENIDVLTLTATPIPRTMQMSLIGVRSLSQLQVAPSNRMPIQTYLVNQSDDLIREAIEKELARNGQVYYLHNETFSIYSTANKIQRLVKDARIDVVHGKMDKEDIEVIMNKFYAGEIDVLVCTSIIETGIDIANVNTILIEKADRFGLSQLYQIKGRVGRSNRIAYAYLMYNQDKELNDKAKKRLKTIKDFTELGSGFKISQRDLAIRGAGDILGPEQAGFIDTIGIDMYIRLLNEAIKTKTQKLEEEKEQQEVNVTNVKIDAYIPKEFIEDVDKMDIYRELSDITTLVDLKLYENKVKDIYGRVPDSVKAIFTKRKIDILSSSAFIDKVEEDKYFYIITLTSEASKINRIGLELFESMADLVNIVRATFENKKVVLKLIKDKGASIKDLSNVLEIVSTTCSRLKNNYETR